MGYYWPDHPGFCPPSCRECAREDALADAEEDAEEDDDAGYWRAIEDEADWRETVGL